MAEQEISFEQAMDKLETVVQQLESGDVPLEKAIELFQQGMELAKVCSGKLDQIERKIEVLVEDGGSFTAKPFTMADGRGE